MARDRFWKFLFPTDSGRWVEILRVGLGLQITLYAWSLRPDWVYLFGTTRSGLVNRALAEAVLSGESWLTPRLGWPITLGGFAGLNETWALWLLWLALLGAGLSLLVGLGGTLMGGQLTGAAMNPARWFAPAAETMIWDNWYVWIIGPLLGAAVAAAAYRFFLLPDASIARTPAEPDTEG